MLDVLIGFRSAIHEDRIMEWMEAVASFNDLIIVEFPQVFPDLPIDEYKRTEAWHILIGSTLPVEYQLTDHAEVVQWMQDKISSFLDSF
jgi:hypothetical protein